MARAPARRGVLWFCRSRTPLGAPALRDQALDRPAGHGKADHGVKSSGSLLIGVVVDLDLGVVVLDGSVAAEDPDGYAGKD